MFRPPHSRPSLTAAALALSAALLAPAASAETRLSDGWVRATVAQQKATGAFGKLSSTEGATLVAVSSPVAGVAQLHEMTMQGDTMKMRHLAQGLVLPAGQTVELKPGGHHVMLMDLKQTLSEGAEVPLTLTLRHADGRTETVSVVLPVRSLGHQAGAMHKH